MVTGAAAASLAGHFTPPVVRRSVPARSQELAPVEDLPTYTEVPEYSKGPIPLHVTRKVVKNHEKKVKQDLKEAYNTEVQCARIKAILPQIYARLTAELDRPRVTRTTTGPAAYRSAQEVPGIEVNFKSRGIDQKALRDHLPALLADYARQVSGQEPGNNSANLSDDTDSHPLSRNASEAEVEAQIEATSARPPLRHASTSSSLLNCDPDRLSVKAGYFEAYTQKIYFSKRFVDLWRKDHNSGKREDLASGIAMVLVGVKLGLPLFDLITFAVLDVPRLTLQGITGKQKLKIRD